MKRIINLLLLSLLLMGCLQNTEQHYKTEQNDQNNHGDIDETEDSNDFLILVNKKHPLSKDYDPKENPDAKEALFKLLEAMHKETLDVSDYFSGYRDYETQKDLYENYVKEHGQEEADTFSARPGYSEHQSGLVFDLFHNDGSFLERNPEAQWLEEHAQEYGFIIRYQKGKEKITGYQHEPWHLRYVGDVAKEIYENNLTLEEFLSQEGGDYESN